MESKDLLDENISEDLDDSEVENCLLASEEVEERQKILDELGIEDLNPPSIESKIELEKFDVANSGNFELKKEEVNSNGDLHSANIAPHINDFLDPDSEDEETLDYVKKYQKNLLFGEKQEDNENSEEAYF